LGKEKKEFNNKNRINKQLLKNIVDAKKLLVKQTLSEIYIHNIIGRSLFLRYVIDREIIPLNTLHIINAEDIFLNKNTLYQAFEIIKKYFNGDLFPVTEDEYNAISNEHLSTLYSLFRGGNISTGQQSLFSFYDFSIIPIELISNIYEKFLHDGNNLKQAHYTPLATVDLVYEQLLGTSLSNKKTLKVLDPSCGSGIFLVAFLKKYFEKHSNKPTQKQIFKFIQKSLFGIDIDVDAIKITIFSIYVTVLEFFEKSFIQKNNFRFPDLLNKNFFVADFFDTNADYNHILGNFDFIVGNPPWGTIKDSLPLYEAYCNNNFHALSDKQIAQAFMYRVSDFMKPHTIVALVLPSKIFYNIGASSFRERFLSVFDIKAIIEMSLERKKTFNGAIHPSAIVFYSKHKDKDNIFTHLTLHPSIFYDLFKMFIFSEENIKSVKQSEIIENHWMWKALLYGSQFDIEFIKKIKRKNSTLKEFLSSYATDFGAGCIPTNQKGRDLSEAIYENYKFLLTDDKENTFFSNNIELINCKHINAYCENNFHDKGNIKSYTAPHLLIKRGISSSGFTVGVTEEDCIFKNSVFGIHHESKHLLNFIAAIYNSNMYQYYAFMTSSSWGVERPEVLMAEHRQLPIPKNISINIIEELSILYERLTEAEMMNHGLTGLFIENQHIINSCIDEINLIVNQKIFELKAFDVELIDYALKNFPQISEDKFNRDQVNQEILNQYISKFTQNIQVIFKSYKNKFIHQVYTNNKFVVVYFTDASNISTTDNILNDNIKTTIQATFDLSIESITNDIAFKRNIFGINQNSFYIIKPNQKSIFHPLNARLDAKAFINHWIMK
jgi:hypothetical protein